VKTDVESLSPTRVKLTVQLPFEELQPSFYEAYKAIVKQVNVPGFRKGKVAARVIEQRFGRGAVLEEVINDAVPKAYENALREQEIVPVGRPEVDVTEIEDGQHVTFTAEVDVRPEFELPDYKAIAVEVEPATATEEAIDEHIDNLRSRFASLKDVERACEDGDVVLVDLSGATDTGEDVEDLSGAALSYEMGTEGMLPGFDEAMRGASAGETRTFPFTPSNGDWTGVPLTVTATITAVRERELPELDEEFVVMASEFDTVDELRADAKNRVERLKRMEQGQQAREKVHEALMESVEVPVPDGIIAAEVDAHFEDGHDATDEHRAEVEQQAREALKSQFILDKIAETEEVTVGESELSNWLMQQAPRYGMAPDALAQALVESGQVQMALSDIRRSKALAVVLENASVTDADGTEIDLAALEAELNEAMQAAQMAQLQAQMAAAQGDEQS